MPSSTSRLFQPITVGQMRLNHRVVLAPLTRVRADINHVPTLPVMKTYYSQRGSTPGTFLISEGTMITPNAGGIKNGPGIYNQAQITAWKDIVEGVHAAGSYIYCQLSAFGHQGIETDFDFSQIGESSSPAPEAGVTVPRKLTIPEIKEFVQLYATAARNAVNEAHFDGVEIHAANGFNIDEFLRGVGDQRQDEYGGSVENRSRFGIEVVRAVVDTVGTAEKVGIRLSPWSPLGMEMDDPIPQFAHFVTVLKQEFSDLAYIHVIEPRVVGDEDNGRVLKIHEVNNFLRDIWSPRPYISAGGYDRQDAIRQADEKGNELMAFGRTFISNPDLPERLVKNMPLTPYNRKTFYQTGDTTGKGYTDYPFVRDNRP